MAEGLRKSLCSGDLTPGELQGHLNPSFKDTDEESDHFPAVANMAESILHRRSRVLGGVKKKLLQGLQVRRSSSADSGMGLPSPSPSPMGSGKSPRSPLLFLFASGWRALLPSSPNSKKTPSLSPEDKPGDYLLLNNHSNRLKEQLGAMSMSLPSTPTTKWLTITEDEENLLNETKEIERSLASSRLSSYRPQPSLSSPTVQVASDVLWNCLDQSETNNNNHEFKVPHDQPSSMVSETAEAVECPRSPPKSLIDVAAKLQTHDP